MNVLWGSADRAIGSAWSDAVAFPSDPGWVGALHFLHVGHPPFEQLPTDRHVAYDEVHPAAYAYQTPEGARLWAGRVTQRSLVAVEWTHAPASQRVVEELLAANNDHVRVCPELYLFGEDGWEFQHCHDVLDWYAARGGLHRICPLFNVAASERNDLLTGDAGKGYRACTYGLAAVSAGWRDLLQRLADAGVYDAALWGCQYRPAWAPADGPAPAVRAFDDVIASVFYGRAA